MGIVEFIILCVVLGVIVWLVNKYAPIPQEIKTIILVAVIIVLIVVLLKATGILGGADVKIPRISK